jgi:hypothetical protein
LLCKKKCKASAKNKFRVLSHNTQFIKQGLQQPVCLSFFARNRNRSQESFSAKPTPQQPFSPFQLSSHPFKKIILKMLG